MDKKITFLIVGLVLVVAIVAVAVLWVWPHIFGSPTPTPTATQTCDAGNYLLKEGSFSQVDGHEVVCLDGELVRVPRLVFEQFCQRQGNQVGDLPVVLGSDFSPDENSEVAETSAMIVREGSFVFLDGKWFVSSDGNLVEVPFEVFERECDTSTPAATQPPTQPPIGTPTPTSSPTPFQPIPPTQPPTGTPTPAATPTPMAPPTQAPTAEPTLASCPTEREFEELTGIRADVVGTEPCAFHWRGDPETIRVQSPCPEGWVCTLGVAGENRQTYVFEGDDTLEFVDIFAGTWRLGLEYPDSDAVHDPCAFLEKVREEGRVSDPQWTAKAGNFSCP